MTSTLLESLGGTPRTSLYCCTQKFARQTPNAESTSGTSRTTLCFPVIFFTQDRSHCFADGPCCGSANPAKNKEPAALLKNSRREAVISLPFPSHIANLNVTSADTLKTPRV